MAGFWRIRNGMSRINLAISRFGRLAKEDIYENSINLTSRIVKRLGLHSILKSFVNKSGLIPSHELRETKTRLQQKVSLENIIVNSSSFEKPLIFVSACVSEKTPGGWKYNGGIKELNYLVKLLRKHGYEAYMVTYDGSYEPWLIEHQPHISIEEFRSKLSSATNVRCVTSYAVAKTFNHECKQLYFWDMELALTEHSQFSVLANLYKNKIKGVAGISRTIQAWHMAYFQQPCTVIPNLIDNNLWFPIEEQRHLFRVGYMDEGQHIEEYLNIIQSAAQESNIDLEFELIKGCEADIISNMRSCEVFLGMNIGKDPLWGEGCPRTNIEALSTGCVVVAFDIIGNREIIQNGFNGILVPRYRPDLMADALVSLYKEPGKLERIRKNTIALLQACHTFDARWPAVKEFLELDSNEKSSLEAEAKRYVELSWEQLQRHTYGEYLLK